MIAAGTLEPTDGDVVVLGQDLVAMGNGRKVRFRRDNVGFVFQQFNLLPALTAAENAAVPLLIAGWKRSDAVAASAQADTILRAQPNHLLGLMLAARAADAKKDAASAKRYRDRLTASATAERAKDLREYTDHKQEIDDALGKPSGKK